MRKKILFFIFMGLFLLLGCTNSGSNQERSPREELNFFYNVQEEEVPSSKAKVYYYGEHYFKE